MNLNHSLHTTTIRKMRGYLINRDDRGTFWEIERGYMCAMV